MWYPFSRSQVHSNLNLKCACVLLPEGGWIQKLPRKTRLWRKMTTEQTPPAEEDREMQWKGPEQHGEWAAWTNLEFEADCHDNRTAAHPSEPSQSQSAPASLVHQRNLKHTAQCLSVCVCVFRRNVCVVHINAATHRHQSEDCVDGPDSYSGVDWLTDASPSEDRRRVIKNLEDKTGGDLLSLQSRT